MDALGTFDILVREHSPVLLVYLGSLINDREVVDELYQETLVVAWRNLDRFDKSRSFGRWLRGIARRLVLAHHSRRAADKTLYSAEVLDIIDTRCEALHDHPLEMDTKLGLLRECVNQLPAQYQRAITMRYGEEIKGQGLATTLGTSLENSKKLIQRGREMLARCFMQKVAWEESGQ